MRLDEIFSLTHAGSEADDGPFLLLSSEETPARTPVVQPTKFSLGLQRKC